MTMMTMKTGTAMIVGMLLMTLMATASLNAQSTETFTDSGGSCSVFTVSHNGAAAPNWVCQAPITGGAVDDATSIGFSVVLNPDGSFTGGYIAFYGQNGQQMMAATNFSGTMASGTFTGSYSGMTPAGEAFTGDATQILASRTVVNRYGRHTYYSVGAGSGGDVTFANND